MPIGLNLYPEGNLNRRICPRCGYQNKKEIKTCESCNNKFPLIVRDALISLKEVEKKFNQLDILDQHARALHRGRRTPPLISLFLMVEKNYSNDDPIAIEFSCEPYLEDNEGCE